MGTGISSTMVGHKIAAIWLGSLAISAARAQSWKEKKRTHQGLPVTSPDIFRQISREESSTGRWFNRLVTIENNLKRNNLISGQNIFKNRAGGGGIEDDHIPF